MTSKLKVAVAMPLYNEADGIEITLTELDRELTKIGAEGFYFIQNDCSTDDSLDVLIQLNSKLNGRIKVETNSTNLRHGPTTRLAYLRATQSDVDIVIQLDSDGQFKSAQVASILKEFASDPSTHLIIGARRNRTDPWYRRFITSMLRLLIIIRFGIYSPDPNSPIRVVRKNDLKLYLEQLHDDNPIPNIALTILYHKGRKSVRYMPIDHLVRRGHTTTGTMWADKRSKILIPRSLITFCLKALRVLTSLRV